ncbi:hypothetical protein ACET3Z_000079 [Daucus carota]
MGGCFLGWFLSSKRRKRSNSGSPRRKIDGGNVTSGDQVVRAPGKGTNLVAELSEKCMESQLSLIRQKRVTFDSNVETFEHVPFCGSTDSLVVSNNVVDDEGENEEGIGDSSDSITFSLGDTTISELGSYPKNNVVDDRGKNEEGIGDSSESITFSVGDATISEVVSYPRNNRYQNCGDTDDDAIDSEYEGSVVSDTDDDYDIKSDGEGMLCEEVWSEAITTASLESIKDMSLTGVDLQEVNSPLESRTDMSLTGAEVQGVNSPVVCSGYSENVLSPVENLNQWKAANLKGLQPMKAQEKENLAADGEAPRISFSSGPKTKESLSSCKPSSDHPTENQSNDSGIESSLSNWLVSPDIKTRSGEETKNSISRGSPSVRNIEDRPILGAWTQEEVKLFSASPSPRKSPRRNPDDMPIIGTVGTYWKHENEVEDCGSATSCKKKNSGSPTSYKGIPNTTSKYREDKKVRWHSTPFKKRLEKALDSGGSEEA